MGIQFPIHSLKCMEKLWESNGKTHDRKKDLNDKRTFDN